MFLPITLSTLFEKPVLEAEENKKQEEEFNQAMLDAIQERIYNEIKNM